MDGENSTKGRNVGWKAHCAVSLMRTWVAAKKSGNPQLATCLERADALGVSDQAAVACAGLFEAVERDLQRSLVPECCCSLKRSCDEQLIVTLLLTQTKGGVAMSDDSPMLRLLPAAHSAAFALGFDVVQGLGSQTYGKATPPLAAQCPSTKSGATL